ncbi:MAG: hypothetical protein RIS35_511, partial [Pseudomonadota bacterium]
APRALVNTHARAVIGRDACREALDGVIDALNCIHDQTLRGILHGLGPDDLRAFVKLPPHLADHPHNAEVYGEVSHFGPYLFNHALGWFDGDAASINPLAPDEQARRLVDAMGGTAAVRERARAALAAGEAAWAAQLLTYLRRVTPDDATTRMLKADALEAMGRVTPAATTRSWYVTQARALRGEIRVPRLQFPAMGILAMAPPAATIDQYRVRVDPQRCADADRILVISIVDRAARHALHLRRGVVEFVANPADCARAPDLEVETRYDNWLRFFSCRRSLEDFLGQALVARGTPEAARAFFDAFDFFAPEDNTIVR